jgi:hypothetical protein
MIASTIRLKSLAPCHSSLIETVLIGSTEYIIKNISKSCSDFFDSMLGLHQNIKVIKLLQHARFVDYFCDT